MDVKLWLFLRTTFMIALLTGLLMAMGYLLGGARWMTYMFWFAVGMSFLSLWYSDQLVLKMMKAKIVSREEAPELYEIVEKLSKRAGLPMPRIAIIDDPTPNAFATGRNAKHALVTVTTRILELLDRDELEGVLGHELTHVKNHDILVGTIAGALAGAVVYIAYITKYLAFFKVIFGGLSLDRFIYALLIAITAPIAAIIIRSAISRRREFAADEGGARLSGKPWALASALLKLDEAVKKLKEEAAAKKKKPLGNPGLAHLFIVNHFEGDRVSQLLATHPPTRERIAHLREIAKDMGVEFPY
ncbi:protease [Thermococcus radiotolerans]|uniref:Protease HtpX homolog n=1 Tax=Thermococcus radiotolerans TaxID=187880 RepID=A0A2Z2MX69_9EURY|nr:M48 family metalloprotease [Thermococcus radiotolerans]ASJ14014.1 protease [Thermococcus radiotolerans]